MSEKDDSLNVSGGCLKVSEKNDSLNVNEGCLKVSEKDGSLNVSADSVTSWVGGTQVRDLRSSDRCVVLLLQAVIFAARGRPVRPGAV